MSKKSKQEEPLPPIEADEPEGETVDATDDVELTSDDAVSVDAAPAVKTAKAKSGIAWFALLIAVIALAAAGLLLFDHWRSSDSVEHEHSAIADLSADLGAKISSNDAALSDLDGKIATLSDDNRALHTRLETQQRAIEQRNQLLDSLPVRMSGLENSVAAMQGVSAGTRDSWLLGEAEYYMQIANAQLQLAGNPHLAILA